MNRMQERHTCQTRRLRFKMPAFLKPALAVAVVALASAQQCVDKYQCIFHADVPSGRSTQEYSWDMHQLCRQGSEYWVQIGTTDQYIAFNICGNTTSMCSYDPTVSLYNSRGAAIQYLQGWSMPLRFQPVTLNPNTPCPTGQANNCTDFDNYPATTDGQAGCCSQPCEVIATNFARFSMVDPTNPKGGVQFRFSALGSLADDPFQCGTDITGQLQIERQTTVIINCDPNGRSDRVANLVATEISTCDYVITGTSAAACGVSGDPFDGYRDDPGHSFGFVVLGSVLAIFVSFTYSFADARGWLDPIKRQIPPASSIPGYSSVARLFGGSGGYAKASYATTASSSAATPITAGAYGSA